MKTNIVFPAYQFDTLENAGFDPKQYSLLKFGHLGCAKEMGCDLATQFFNTHQSLILTEKLIVIPSPYNYVENAATMMTHWFYRQLNRLIYEVNGQPAEYTTIQRKVSYTHDYGFLSKEHRKGLLDNDEFYINREYMQGKTIVFVDDVKITGTHEDKLKEILTKESLDDRGHFFLYYAQYLGDRAEIESELNFTAAVTPETLSALLNHGGELLIRPIKFIMSMESDKFKEFIDNQLCLDKKIELYDKCLAEGYHYIPKYLPNFQQLRGYLKTTSII